MLQSVPVYENCYDQRVHKPQFAMNALYHLSLTIKIKALFFTAVSISPAPRICLLETAKSQIISITSRSSHQPVAISSIILFNQNFRIFFYHVPVATVTHDAMQDSGEYNLKKSHQ